MRRTASVIVVGVVALAAACAQKDVRLLADPPASVDQLWQEPSGIGQRDLFHGVRLRVEARRATTFIFVTRDTTGWSPGFDVRDNDGIEWSVKRPEAQTEVVASRILWAIGYHQPPTYYIDGWSLTGQESGPQEAGRFRPSLANRKVVGDWSWYENPFVGSRVRRPDRRQSHPQQLGLEDLEQQGVRPVRAGERGPPMVRGARPRASLGKTSYPGVLKWFRLRGFGQGTRNDLPGFEEQGFIKRIDPEYGPEFDYSGIYRDVIDTVTPADVVWVCGLLDRLTDDQWRDAFRAGGYTAEQTDRYVRKIKAEDRAGAYVDGRVIVPGTSRCNLWTLR